MGFEGELESWKQNVSILSSIKLLPSHKFEKFFSIDFFSDVYAQWWM